MKPHLRSFCVAVSAVILHASSLNAQTPDLGKSYINVTKGNTGGTVETGDTLEVRASFVVRAGTFDSCAFFDVVPAGTTYITGTVRVLTNEGKIYKQFTDAAPDDEGWITGSNIRINLGYKQADLPATRYRRGRVANNHFPSFFGGSCIMIASYRIRVTAATGTIINTGGGSATYKSGTNPIQTYTFPLNRVAIYTNFGICSNTVGVNSLGTEFNGTFGSGRPRNRGTSGNVPVGYTYNRFTSNSPQDYYYGVANNTSTQNYTTSNAWPKPDNSTPSHRVFGVWDIIGDHTGAAIPALGNPAADTVASASGGYMLIINAAYKIDSAFQHTISGLCPNTYYEISCWVRNICSECGCDSTGTGASGATYIPTAPGDSAGVRPNLTFEVDGVDYYTSGNMLYTGRWIKKGFTYRTGATQTSFTLKFFNNAPGGGGNDWALDDISIATCSPDLLFTPTNNPTFCRGDVVNIGCTIKSYFNNYTNYKWQKSINNGITWTDSGPAGTGVPIYNGSEWVYNISYPPFVASATDSGNKYKVVVATTVPNLSDANCAFSETVSVITLRIIDCGSPLVTTILSFAGWREKNKDVLTWSTSRETEPLQYFVEKSGNGQNFSVVAMLLSGTDSTMELNRYNCTAEHSGGVAYYRVRIVNGSGSTLYSRIIRLGAGNNDAQSVTVTNPFDERLILNFTTAVAGEVMLRLYDGAGQKVRSQKCIANAANNRFTIYNTSYLVDGLYTLQVETGGETITKKVVKISL